MGVWIRCMEWNDGMKRTGWTGLEWNMLGEVRFRQNKTSVHEIQKRTVTRIQ